MREWEHRERSALQNCVRSWWVDIPHQNYAFVVQHPNDPGYYLACADDDDTYPFSPKDVAGPFDSLDAAKAAYLVVFGDRI